MNQTNQNCKSCKWCDIDSDSGDYDTPPSFGGYTCMAAMDNDAVIAHLLDIAQVEHPETVAEDLDGVVDGCDAVGCPGYEERQSEPDDCSWYDEPLTDEQVADIEAQQEESDRQHAIAVGWLDAETGEPTDAYLRLSDWAYDASRG